MQLLALLRPDLLHSGHPVTVRYSFTTPLLLEMYKCLTMSSSLPRLQVGFFPCDCVELINDKIPPSVQNSVPKPGTRQRTAV